jgi:tRNA U34 2-thiouridine synthase MnmA/TrmU
MLIFVAAILLNTMTVAVADNNEDVFLQYRAEVKNITLSNISYPIQLGEYIGKSEGASFLYIGEKSGLLVENDSYVFANGLQLTVKKLTRSDFDSTGVIYIQLDDTNITLENKKSQNVKVGFVEWVLKWFKAFILLIILSKERLLLVI